MLSKVVKKFIEQNIEYINEGDWKNVFMNWYLTGDDYYLYDLEETFKRIGINILQESKNIREKILLEVAKNIFTGLKLKTKTITFATMLDMLRSNLGFHGEEWKKVLNEAALSQGLHPCSIGWEVP